ncbi:conjugal transfer protein TrbL [Microbacterium sp. C7(2022)]|uniref:conjugal transfer protein TrbL n=1 Tax=Microbacterium sp. C7(2022) TaxID=2992759 RepID=UPI00237BD13C|nr:conjugal transfer protein TrbL [Microbacterium sp. C7(2022)]MDE0545941.1 type IV secretion system protein [Microbacterium sp. C7(2022)]
MSVCDIPVIAPVCTAVGENAASLIAAPFDWLASAMGATAGWLFTAVWAVFDTTTLVDLSAPGYVGVYNVLFGIAIFVTLVLFCLQLITALVRRDPSALGRAGTGLAKSVLGSFVILTVTGLLIEITDQLTIGIVQATGNTMESIGDRIALLVAGLATINIAAPGVGAILTIFLAGLAISSAAIVWFSLLIRKALLLVAIVFGPIALAGMTWDATKGWFGKWAAFVLALILSKLVLVVIFLVAIAQVAAPIDSDLASVGDPVAGIVLMFVAAFAPYITYKFLSFVGFDMYHAMSSEQEAKSALNRPAPVPASVIAGGARQVLGTSNGPGSGASGAPGATSSGAVASPAGASGATAGVPASSASAGAAGLGAVTGIGAGVVAGAAVVHGIATAAPKAGAAVGRAAEAHGAESTASEPARSASGTSNARPAPTPPPPVLPTKDTPR